MWCRSFIALLVCTSLITTLDFPSWAFKVESLSIAQARKARIPVKTLQEFSGTIDSLALSPNGQTLVVATGDGKIDAIALKDDSKIYTKRVAAKPSAIAITPNGQLLAAAVGAEIILYDLGDGSQTARLRGHVGKVSALVISPDSKRLVSISPDGRTVATANKEGTIALWDLATGRAIATLSGHRGWVLSLAFSTDGKYLYSGAEDKTVKVWQAF
jgi:WD40 repeat protein